MFDGCVVEVEALEVELSRILQLKMTLCGTLIAALTG
jgi:hypothetical protein